MHPRPNRCIFDEKGGRCEKADLHRLVFFSRRGLRFGRIVQGPGVRPGQRLPRQRHHDRIRRAGKPLFRQGRQPVLRHLRRGQGHDPIRPGRRDDDDGAAAENAGRGGVFRAAAGRPKLPLRARRAGSPPGRRPGMDFQTAGKAIGGQTAPILWRLILYSV